MTDKRALDALFGKKPPEHWTAAILASLREKAHAIKVGRLKWVLSTALPLNPGFNLWLNGDELESSKQKGERIWTWIIGTSDAKKKRWRYNELAASGLEYTIVRPGSLTGALRRDLA